MREAKIQEMKTEHFHQENQSFLYLKNAFWASGRPSPFFKPQMRPQMSPEDAQKLNKWARSIGPTETFFTHGLGP